jgi:hypothetical protein
VTIDAAPSSTDTAVDLQAVVDIAGAPPWAAEPTAAEPEAPPPWESGPWPSRGQTAAEDALREQALPEHALPPSRRAESRPAEPGDWSADRGQRGYESPDGRNGGAPARHAAGGPAAGPAESADNNLATAALIAGVAGILVVPGIVLGILGLRRARDSGTGQTQSWLGIGLSLAWALGIIIFVALPGHGSSADSGCSAYQADGQAAVARVTSALGSGAPASQVRKDLSAAASAVNTSAAQADNVGVRSALSALTADLQEGLREVRPQQAAPSSLGTTLRGDSAALAKLCR